MTKTWLYIGAGTLVFLGGFITGRELHWGNKPASDVVVSTSPDGGVPTAVAAVTTTPSSCDAGVHVVIRPGKPTVIYLPADGGEVLCPTCPEVVVDANTGSTTGGTSAHADAPVITITKTEYRDKFRVFGLGPAVSFPYAGGVGYGAVLTVQPASWLEFNGVATTKEVMVDAQFRFDL